MNTRHTKNAMLLAVLLVNSVYATPGRQGSISERAAIDQAKIVVYRGLKGEYAVSMPAYIDLNGQRLSKLSKDTFAVYCVAPGTYDLGVHLEDALIYSKRNRKSALVQLEGGKSYFFRVPDQIFEKYGPLIPAQQEQVFAEIGTTVREAQSLNSEAGLTQKCRAYVPPPPPPPEPVVLPQPVPVTPPQQLYYAPVPDFSSPGLSDVTYVDEPVAKRKRTAKVSTTSTKPVAKTHRLSGDVLFNFGQSTVAGLKPGGRQELKTITKGLTNQVVKRVDVVAHTDRIGSAASNQRLSQQRANSIKSFVINQTNVSPIKIFAVGKGETQPVKSCDNANRQQLINCLQPNRRAVITVTKVINTKKPVKKGR